MPRHDIPTGNPTGRPRISAYDDLSKVCETCGSIFRLRDSAFQSRAKFGKRRFCSRECITSTDRSMWDRVVIDQSSGCWEWNGQVGHNGYGLLTVRGKPWRAHRYSYFLKYGSIPDGMMILHSCDNRRCVNPEHLRIGTAKDNAADAIARGRFRQNFATRNNKIEAAVAQ